MVPDGWKQSDVGEHVDLLSGFPFKSSEYSDDPEDIRLLRGDNIGQGQLRWRDAKRWDRNQYNEFQKYHLEPGDLIIAMDRTWVTGGLKVAEVREADVPSLLLQRVSRLRASKTLDQRLLWFLINSYRFEQYVKSVQTETAVPHISARQIKEFPIPIPPLPEQRKIADILSTWERAIETTEALLATARTQKRALMQSLLTGKRRFPEFEGQDWKEVRLDRLAIIKKGQQKSKATLLDDGEFPVINGGVGPSGYTDEWNTEAGTITISEGGNSCGFVNLIDRRFWSGGHCYTLEDLRIRRDFLFHSLKFHEPKIMSLRVGSGLPNIQKKAVSGVQIGVPSEAEQRRIEDVLNTAWKEENSLVSNIEKLRTEKQALMQQLLNGKRRVVV